jgi:hypothetical protein
MTTLTPPKKRNRTNQGNREAEAQLCKYQEQVNREVKSQLCNHQLRQAQLYKHQDKENREIQAQLYNHRLRKTCPLSEFDVTFCFSNSVVICTERSTQKNSKSFVLVRTSLYPR